MLQIHTHNLYFHLRNVFWVGGVHRSSKPELGSNSAQYQKNKPMFYNDLKFLFSFPHTCRCCSKSYFCLHSVVITKEIIIIPVVLSSSFWKCPLFNFYSSLYLTIHFLYVFWHNISTFICITQAIVKFTLWCWPQFFCSMPNYVLSIHLWKKSSLKFNRVNSSG